MVWMSGGSSITLRTTGGSSGTAPQDFNGSDIALAFANGWTALPQSQYPGILDVPDYGAPANTVGALNTYKVFQTSLPMIMAPSGTGSTAGAITLGTAGPTGFWGGSCYLYLPASCLGGNANTAGWYYALLTSTTVGTVYNNTYATGLPFIPGSAVLTAFAGAGSAYTGVTSAQAALTWTLPGNSMGANGILEISGVIGFNGSANNKTVTIKIGSTTIFSLVEATSTVKAYQFLIQVGNMNATNAQMVQNTGTPGASTVANTYSAIDTTQNQTVTVNVTNATATDWTAIESFSAVVTPG